MRGPGWAEWLVQASAGRVEAEWVLAELEAEAARRAEREGPAAARRWYGREALRSAGPLVLRRVELSRRRRRAERRQSVSWERMRDIRYAIRGWRRTPAFTALAVLMLGLGIGGTLAVFGVVNGVLLAPLPYANWERLVHVEGQAAGRYGVTYPTIEDLRAQSRALEEVVAWQGWQVVLPDADGVPLRRPAASVSANFFEVLGAGPALGRLFGPEDEPLGHAPVVVLSHALWQSEFGGDPGVVGRLLRADGTSGAGSEAEDAYTIIGVAPEGFRDPVAEAIDAAAPALWRSRPPVFDVAQADRGWIGFWAFGRLRPGVSAEVASAEARRIERAALPDAESDPELNVATFRERQVRAIRPTLMLLFGAVLGVLLIACGNLANLLLSRATGRTREVAVRASLGASRARLIRQLLTETLVLCLAGGAVGLAIAWAGGNAILGLAGGELPPGTSVTPDARVILFAVALSVLCALIAGLVPTLRLTEARLGSTLREASRSGLPARGGQRFRHGLVVAETALAVMLLAGAGLLLRSAWNLLRTDPGFDAEQVLTLRVSLLPSVFTTGNAQNEALNAVLSRIAALPGVTAAGAISDLPMSGAVNSTPVRDTERQEERGVQTLVRTVTPDFFPALGIQLERGRTIGAMDHGGAPPVAVVNRTFVERLFGSGVDPIGRTVVTRGVTQEIVGVVEDVKEFTLSGGPDPVLYTSYPQETQPWMRSPVSVTVRTTGDPAGLAAAVRSAVHDAAPMATVDGVRPLSAYLDVDTQAPRFRAILLGTFAALGLVLAAVGTGGLAAYTVSRRLPEMGLRMALGATRGEVGRLVLRQAFRLTLAGVILGVVGALLASRLLSGFLFGVPPTDLAVLGGSALLLGFTGVVSSWPPAARASRADPATTLRGD